MNHVVSQYQNAVMKQNQYKTRKRTRLEDYDYSQSGFYYVTICTKDREYCFGNIVNDRMTLNPWGNIAKNAWLRLPNHHNNVDIDVFVVMPNHIHGIIIINKPVGNGPARSTIITNSLSVIIGSYKSTVTKQINRIDAGTFKWQKSFYDHIIRKPGSLQNIREYIVNNHSTWNIDENNLINHKITVQAGLNPTGNINGVTK